MPTTAAAPPGERGLRLPEVVQRVGMSRAWIYDEIKAGRFPRPVKIGTRASAWLASEIDAFLASRVLARDTSVDGAA